MKKLVVITGATSGIGAAIAERFAQTGHPLLLIGYNNIPKESKYKNAIYAKVDVSNLNDLKNAIKNAEEKYGETDLLVNNAGVLYLGKPWDQDPQEWKKMNDINIMGVLNGIHCVLADMIKRKKGTIINISSTAGRKTFFNHASYCGTKFAVKAITENIRSEVADKGVRIIDIAPGVVETSLLSKTTNSSLVEEYKSWKKDTMDGVGLSADYVAQTIEFAYNLPQEVCIRDIHITKTSQVE